MNDFSRHCMDVAVSGEPSKRNEIVHDLWYQGNPDPEKRNGLKPHWAALHLDGMKLLIGSGATSWQLYNITRDPTGMQFALVRSSFVG